jgi:DNA-binding transcriptional regulator LsrR (DeoR family)
MEASLLTPGRLRLITKAAKLRYEARLSQTRIAAELKLSQATVSRLLHQADDLGLVRTTVTPPPGVHTELESQLEQRFGLDEAVVTDTPSGSAPLTPALGAAGAAYLESVLTEGDRLGFSSWSSASLAVAESIGALPSRRVAQVVQVLGGLGASSVQGRANRLVDRLAAMTGAEAKYLAAPGLMDTPQAAAAVLADGSLRPVAAAWENLTVLLTGIGATEPSPLYRASGNAISKNDEDRLRAAGAVGDVLLRYFDAAGQLVESDLYSRVVGIPLNQLRAVPRRIGVAGGPRKAEAILAASRGGWINVLVTEAETARTVLRTHHGQP